MSNPCEIELVNRYIVAYNSFDIEGMLEVLSPQVRFENYSGGQMNAQATGKDEFRRLAERSRTLFSEREQRATAIESTGDRIVAAIAYRGRLAADIPGGPCRGTMLELNGQSEFTFRDGLIAAIVDRS